MAKSKPTTHVYLTIYFNNMADSGYGDFDPATDITVPFLERVGMHKDVFDVMRADPTVACYQTHQVQKMRANGLTCISDPFNHSVKTYFGTIRSARDMMVSTRDGDVALLEQCPEINPDAYFIVAGMTLMPEAGPRDRVFNRETGEQIWPQPKPR